MADYINQGENLLRLSGNHLNALVICARKPHEYAFSEMILAEGEQCVFTFKNGDQHFLRMRTPKL